MKKNILEITVDKNNEKGAGVFEHILVILHEAYDDYHKGFFSSFLSPFSKGRSLKNRGVSPSFSLEITKMGNRIRFFIISPVKYTKFLQNQIYAHFPDVEINEVEDYFEKIPKNKIIIGEIGLSKHFLYPIKTFTELQIEGQKDVVDPYSSITSALSRTGNYSLNTIQINFEPVKNNIWKKDVDKTVKILTSDYPKILKKILLNPNFIYFKILLFPFILIFKFIKLFIPKGEINIEEKLEEKSESKVVKEEVIIDDKKMDMPLKFLSKISGSGFRTSLNIIHVGEDMVQGKMAIKEIASTLGTFANFGGNSFKLKSLKNGGEEFINIKERKVSETNNFILNVSELSGLVHLPTNYVKTPQINWVLSRNFEPPSNLPLLKKVVDENFHPLQVDLTPVGTTNFRGTNLDFGIGPSDRRRHMYIIGKTGMGKSTLLENMIIDDIRKGRGVAVIDPHGDLAEGIIGFIPKSRTNQTIIFDPSDVESPIAFNMLDNVSPEQRSLVASGLVGIFKKIFGDSWGPRLEHILRNIIFALIEYPNTTLVSIPLMLTSETFRNKVISKITDRVVKNFWTQEYAKMAPNQKTEAAGPILNKVGQFLSSTILRNILGQSKNTFSIRWAMDNKKIVIVNLSKGKIGEDASALLGSMMVTKFQMDAMSRADIPEKNRVDFYLYVDEFQNFATDSFATILSEARKYKLNLVMANQYIDQMSEEVRGAVFGNVGSIVSFQVGHNDAKILKELYSGDILEEDLMNIKKYNIYSKLLVDGMPTTTFSASTFAPNKKDEKIFASRYEKILSVSREKYSKPKKKVEDSINKMLSDIEKQEKEWDKKKEDFKKKKDDDKKKAYEERKKKEGK
ncbi:MAG: type IV secretion system DNA-binding domain-containing protein [Candidatus Gracilibacteria bacterium]|nr:type IV secretion system DNA-binding domain-containing protein [Candidatus Gracilibacteria bacterium]